MENTFEIDDDQEEVIKHALDLAIRYCEEHGPSADSWSKERLAALRTDFFSSLNRLGKSLVVGRFRS